MRYFLFQLFGYVERRYDKKAQASFKTYDAKDWTTNYGNTQIAQHSRSKGYDEMEVGYLIEYNMRNIFAQISCRKWDRVSSSRPLFVFQIDVFQTYFGESGLGKRKNHSILDC